MSRTGSDTGAALGDGRRRAGSARARGRACLMTVNAPARPTTTDLPGPPPEARRQRPPRPERGSSPREGVRVRPLSRRQIEDHLQELGDLYAETSGGGPWAWNQARGAFLRRLAADVRRPGFELLIAESTGLTGCAFGFPLRGDGPGWEGFDGYLPGRLLRLAAGGRLFVVSGILVPPRVRWQNQDRAWNLARRLQKRLLTDHGAALGVTLVNRSDTETVEALRSWGWRYLDGDTPRTSPHGPFRVLVLGT
ncbi:hypothetical protein GCM10027074_34600 [Streptomyces deserti]